jgi:hypothetical protein
MSYFQPRGNVYLRPLDANLVPGVAFAICPDAVSISPKVQTWTHINKCGLVDAEDARGIVSISCDGTMQFATKTDKDRALAFLGTVNAAAGSPSSVTNEAIPEDPRAGDVIFLGGKTRHRAITGLSIGALVADTDYTLDAATGKVTFLTDVNTSPNPTASYSHTDPQSVSMLTAAGKEYAFDMEAYNRQDNNKKCSVELYRIRPDPTSTADFMPNQQQDLTLAFSALVDTTRDVLDTVFGQFGRLVNIE